jgi:putative transposase
LPEWYFLLYKLCAGVRRTKHAVYDLKYHLVQIPKYRKDVLSAEVSQRLKEVFQSVTEG